MHGLILVQLQKFAQQSVGFNQWRDALQDAGLDHISFSAGLVYEDTRASEMIGLTANILGVTVDEVLESFGRFLALELVRLYQRVIKPEWKTLDIIENTETFIHSAVRTGNPGAVPPVLDAIRLSDDELQLLYSSDRKLCKLAVGIIKGLADHFHEVIEIKKDSCMLSGDPYCTFSLKRSSLKRDTQKLTLNNTIQSDLQGNLTSVGSASAKTVIGSAATNSEPTLWDQYLSPPLFESDFASIGPYRLLARQGEGGMGCVFRSIDTRTEQSVAIKVLHPKVANDSTALARFFRELQALQKINHSHVVEIRDVGQIGQLPYLVMEFLRGTNLQVYSSRFLRLPIHETIRIARETVCGLKAVHDAGIIHRDLKPENLWIETPSLNVKIIDFGLAQAEADEMRLTRTGTFIGTPNYMAPEQANGQGVDLRADFFSLGCVLYELATGVRCFDRGTVMATLSALANFTPTQACELVEEIPKDFSDLVSRMLEKSPSNRPKDCQEILTVLDQLVEKLD